MAHRLFVNREHPELLRKYEIKKIKFLTSFFYLGTGGFRGPQLLPKSLKKIVQAIDNFLSSWPSLFSIRIITVLEKTAE